MNFFTSIRSNLDKSQDEPFRSRPVNLIDMNQSEQNIDWEVYHRERGKHYVAKVECPETSTCLIVDIICLQFMYDMSNEEIVDLGWEVSLIAKHHRRRVFQA